LAISSELSTSKAKILDAWVEKRTLCKFPGDFACCFEDAKPFPQVALIPVFEYPKKCNISPDFLRYHPSHDEAAMDGPLAAPSSWLCSMMGQDGRRVSYGKKIKKKENTFHSF
jgi:hypothetical protein